MKVDMIDRLIERLNAIEGIEFVRDAWINDAPENYGVVELTGESESQYADDGMTEQAFRLRITIYVKDGEDAWLDAVQTVLAAEDLAYSLPNRAYDYGGDAVMWQWQAVYFGPLTWEEPDGEDDDGEDDG